MNGVKLIIDDKITDYNDKMDYALENDDTNLVSSYNEAKGFQVSIFDKETNVIRYYKVVDSELVLESVEDVMTGNKIEKNDK